MKLSFEEVESEVEDFNNIFDSFNRSSLTPEERTTFWALYWNGLNMIYCKSGWTEDEYNNTLNEGN